MDTVPTINLMDVFNKGQGDSPYYYAKKGNKQEDTKFKSVTEKKVIEPIREKKAEDERHFGDLVKSLADNTGMHGVHNIKQATTGKRKFFWLFVLTTGLGMLTWQVTEAFLKYYSYPTSTTIQIVQKSELPFPSVTICNINPVKMSQLSDCPVGGTGYDMKMLLGMGGEHPPGAGGNDGGSSGGYNPGYNPPPTPTTSTDDNTTESTDFGEMTTEGQVTQATTSQLPLDANSTAATNETTSEYEYDDYWDWDVLEDKAEFFMEESDEFVKQENFIKFYAQYNRKERTKLGHRLKSMMMECRWNGRPCTPKNFTQSTNFFYGNCYTFNTGVNSSLLTTTKPGPLHGLQLELNVEQYEYLGDIADAAGIRVIIHNQTEFPFPEDAGFSVKPGSLTNVAIDRKDIVRPASPYGECKNFTDEEAVKLNAFVQELGHVKYSRQACTATCFQRKLLQTCNCYDFMYPISEEAHGEITRNISVCNSNQTTEQGRCHEGISEHYTRGTLGCSEECPEVCNEIQLDPLISTAEWPSLKKEGQIFQTLRKSSKVMRHLMDSIDHEAAVKLLRSNLVKLQIYYKDMSFERIVKAASYTEMDLLSDVGGQVGLWLGFSVITAIEFLEFVGDAMLLVMTWRNRKRVDPDKESKQALKKAKLAFM